MLEGVDVMFGFWISDLVGVADGRLGQLGGADHGDGSFLVGYRLVKGGLWWEAVSGEGTRHRSYALLSFAEGGAGILEGPNEGSGGLLESSHILPVRSRRGSKVMNFEMLPIAIV